jgi:hypothetical protein
MAVAVVAAAAASYFCSSVLSAAVVIEAPSETCLVAVAVVSWQLRTVQPSSAQPAAAAVGAGKLWSERLRGTVVRASWCCISGSIIIITCLQSQSHTMEWQKDTCSMQAA